MSEGKKYEPIPLWLDRKLLKRMGVMGVENKDLSRGYLYGSHECFEILWPQIELLHAALKEGAFQGVDFGHGPYTSDYVLAARNAIDKLEDMK